MTATTRGAIARSLAGRNNVGLRVRGARAGRRTENRCGESTSGTTDGSGGGFRKRAYSASGRASSGANGFMTFGGTSETKGKFPAISNVFSSFRPRYHFWEHSWATSYSSPSLEGSLKMRRNQSFVFSKNGNIFSSGRPTHESRLGLRRLNSCVLVFRSVPLQEALGRL